MQDVEDEPLFAERVAGLDIAKAEVEVTIRVPSDTRPGRRQQETRTFGTTRRRAAGAGGLAALLGRDQGRDGGHRRLLETGVLRAGITRVRLRAVQRRAGQGPAGQAQDRPGRLGLARQDHRAGDDLLQLRAARADPQAAHPHPLPPSPHPGPHRREAAGGETAGRRAPEAVVGDLRHPRGLGPGHAGARSPPGNATPRRWPSWPAARMRGKIRRLEEALDCSFFTERARRRAGDDARRHRPLHRPDRPAHRQDRGAGRAVPAPDRRSSTPCTASG